MPRFPSPFRLACKVPWACAEGPAASASAGAMAREGIIKFLRAAHVTVTALARDRVFFQSIFTSPQRAADLIDPIHYWFVLLFSRVIRHGGQSLRKYRAARGSAPRILGLHLMMSGERGKEGKRKRKVMLRRVELRNDARETKSERSIYFSQCGGNCNF